MRLEVEKREGKGDGARPLSKQKMMEPQIVPF